MTTGFFIFAIVSKPQSPAAPMPPKGSAVQASLTELADTVSQARAGSKIHTFSYQMAVTTQSVRSEFGVKAWLGVRAAFRRLIGLGIAAGMLTGVAHAAGGDTPTGSVSGLPVPRFVSLKSDKVNVRSGPNKDQEVRWVYTRAGMPVEVTAEFENWRRIRDWEGAEGWVYHSLLAGKRSAVVVPSLKDDLVPLFEKADGESAVVARLQSGVLGQLKSCNGLWCEFSGKDFSGWIKQERLWGAYPNEKVD
jgi:SH3-like domain-containing protein